MAAYYRFNIGSGLAWVNSYVVKVDKPTTDYGALTDMLIDYMVSKGDNHILDMDEEYEWDDNYENIYDRDNHTWILYPDQFVQGGNCGNVMMHYGEFQIYEIQESEITNEDEMVEAA